MLFFPAFPYLCPNRVLFFCGICQKPKTKSIGILFCSATGVYPIRSDLPAVKPVLDLLRREALLTERGDVVRHITERGCHGLQLLHIGLVRFFLQSIAVGKIAVLPAGIEPSGEKKVCLKSGTADLPAGIDAENISRRDRYRNRLFSK